MLNPPHDHDCPLGWLNGLEAASLAADLTLCRWCRPTTTPIPMTGNGWGVETEHESHCPEHEDYRHGSAAE